FYGYFVIQTIWLVMILVVESQNTINAVTANLSILLVFQASVLDIRPRGLLVGVLLGLATLSGIHGVITVEQILPVFISYSLGFGLLLLLGNLIVNGERAAQRSHVLAQYASSVEDVATLRERNRLARDIHDNLGHYLTAINIQLE